MATTDRDTLGKSEVTRMLKWEVEQLQKEYRNVKQSILHKEGHKTTQTFKQYNKSSHLSDHPSQIPSLSKRTKSPTKLQQDSTNPNPPHQDKPSTTSLTRAPPEGAQAA